jgi:hypothetical protein
MKNLADVRLALVFKDFAAWVRSSCVGLNVAGYTTANVLRKHGIKTVVFPVRHNVDIVTAIDAYNESHQEALTHVVISAPWLSVYDLQTLIENFKTIQFVILSHSNVGFLQADPDGVWLLRQYFDLAQTHPNLKVGGNSEKFVHWVQHAYNQEATLLPNLYPLPDKDKVKAPWDGKSALKIGAFGAVRPYKNFMTAAAAAITIQRFLGVPVELHMSTGGEGGTVAAIEQMCAGVKDFKLVKHEWSYWDKFIRLVANMDLLLQVSYTESFNLITADGISVGVPSVVSSAIEWAPDAWKADADNALKVAQVGLRLLRGENREAGFKALGDHNEYALRFWIAYLLGDTILLERPLKWHHKVCKYFRGFFS